MVKRARHPRTENPALIKLWDVYRTEERLAARNALVEYYRPHAARVARRVKMRLPRSVEMADLEAAGDVGLIQAIQNFDPKRGVPFEAFCEHRVYGAILDELRRLDWLPRPMRHRLNKKKEAIEILQGNLGRPPEEFEIAQHLGLSLEDYQQRFGKDHEAPVLAGGKPVSPDKEAEPGLEFLEDSRVEGPIEDAHRRELIEQIAVTLSPENREILYKRFFEARTLKEIGDEMQISQSRVSKILHRIVDRLKERFAQRS
jgi:RNA polymerase sigma factor FliA